eukprot:jgi/Tetstr1/436163/TSEL_025009.t1
MAPVSPPGSGSSPHNPREARAYARDWRMSQSRAPARLQASEHRLPVSPPCHGDRLQDIFILDPDLVAEDESGEDDQEHQKDHSPAPEDGSVRCCVSVCMQAGRLIDDVRSSQHRCREFGGHFHGMCPFVAHSSDDAGCCGCTEAGATPNQSHAHRHALARCVSGHAGTQPEEEEDGNGAWLEAPLKPEPAPELIAQGGLMAAVNRRSRVLEGEYLECMVECFEEAYASEPQRYKNTACTICFGPLLAPVAVVERATWEAQFQLAAWNELGRDWRLSNAAKSFKLCGFPSAPLANWVNDIVKRCRDPSLKAWDREYSSVKYCERGDSEKPGDGRLVRGYVFLTMRAMELMFEQAKVTRYPHILPMGM